MADFFLLIFFIALIAGNGFLHMSLAAPNMRVLSVGADAVLMSAWIFLFILGRLLKQ